MKKPAFSMLELVFVIVVIGILAAMIIPRSERDTVYEATEQVLDHIRYAQHLAMTDNVYDDTNQNWFARRWAVTMCGGTQTDYVIERVDGSEIANDPLSGQPLHWNDFDDLRLTDKYSITNVNTSVGCQIIFDHLGRPYVTAGGAQASSTGSVLTAPNVITLTFSNGDTSTITITPETGFAFPTY